MYNGVKRKVFVSHYSGDRSKVDAFIDEFANHQGVFIPYVLGANDNDDFIDSNNPEYVMTQVREKYLRDTTVTIVLVGDCTHSRRYVDWELKSSLRQGQDTLPNGVMGISLPGQGTYHLPPRLEANWVKGHTNCYARYWAYPSSAQDLGDDIEDAYSARTAKALLISNPQGMMEYNAKCKKHHVTH